jgi:cell division ATPase FtsA
MKLFSSKTLHNEYGIVIDIGSGSVGIAIVISPSEIGDMEIVWSHREYKLIKDTTTKQGAVNEINTTIVNALLELGSSGLKALYTAHPKTIPKYVQVAISAPWSYTITKTISYEDEKPFEVTASLVEQLIETAKKQTLESTLDGTLIEDLGLRMITDDTVDVQLNGYSIHEPVGRKGKSVVLSHISAVAEKKILENVEDSIQRILPKAQVEHFSFMHLFYRVLKDLHPDTSEICLIDITDEATEIGIVRDNILKQTTHVPIGMYTLAREIASACNIPKEDAYTYIKDGTVVQTDKNAAAIEGIFASYESSIAELFSRTGDSLSIPKTLFLHTAKTTEDFFAKRLKEAAKRSTGSTHTVHLFTSELLGDTAMEDTALALSSYYFHTREKHFLDFLKT